MTINNGDMASSRPSMTSSRNDSYTKRVPVPATATDPMSPSNFAPPPTPTTPNAEADSSEMLNVFRSVDKNLKSQFVQLHQELNKVRASVEEVKAQRAA